MICYAFPLAHEAKQILQRCTEKEQFSIDNLHCTLANFRNRRVLIALIGMGPAMAGENIKRVFQYFRPKGLILAGYGGGLVPQLKVGQVVISTNYSSPEIIPFLRLLSGFDFATFCTTDEIVGTPERRTWYARNKHHEVVDMETAAVAEVVHSRLVPFTVVRVISDDFQQVLPLGALAAGLNAETGRPTPVRLLSYLATHPGEIAPFWTFVSNLSLARNNLTRFLEQLHDDLPKSW